MKDLSTSKFEPFLLPEILSHCLATHQIPAQVLSFAFVYQEADGNPGISLRPAVLSKHCNCLISFPYLLPQKKNLASQTLSFFQASTLMITSSLPLVLLHPGLHFIPTV